MSARPYRERRTVLPWPGPPLVLVQSLGRTHSVVMSKPGDVTSTFLCCRPTLAQAIAVARERAQERGWRFVGVRDEAYAQLVASFQPEPDEDII